MKTFKEYLCEFIQDTGLSYSEIARRIGVDQSTVNRWANGERVPCKILQEVVLSKLSIMRGMEKTLTTSKAK